MPFLSEDKRIKLLKNKREIRVIGIDDAPFDRSKKGSNVIVVGAIYRGGSYLDGMVTTKVRCDGMNATDKLIKMIKGSRYWEQLHYIILDGITLGGFNVVDINTLNEATGLPVVAVTRKNPNLIVVKAAISKLKNGMKRWKIIERAGTIYKFNKLYFQTGGLREEEAKLLLNLLCTRSNIPEPLRAAHIIAGAIVTGEGGKRP